LLPESVLTRPSAWLPSSYTLNAFRIHLSDFIINAFRSHVNKFFCRMNAIRFRLQNAKCIETPSRPTLTHAEFTKAIEDIELVWERLTRRERKELFQSLLRYIPRMNLRMISRMFIGTIFRRILRTILVWILKIRKEYKRMEYINEFHIWPPVSNTGDFWRKKGVINRILI